MKPIPFILICYLIGIIRCTSIFNSYSELTLYNATIGNTPFNISSSPFELSERPNFLQQLNGTYEVITTLNEYADKILENLSKKITNLGYDPLKIADMKTGFSWKFLFIRYHGEMELTSGWLVDLSRIHRDGQVELIYNITDDIRKITLLLPMAFDDLLFTYDYSAKLMNLGPSGGINGKISDVHMKAVLSFDYDNQVASLDEFTVTSGRISVHFTGHFLVDWVYNLLSDVICAILHTGILSTIQHAVSSTLQNAIDSINYILRQIVN